ncbi:TIGR02679 family protein [Streptomyces sp. YIM 98790]|uniref:TIGR02679 family protein n=1 Tax=Streptomyces sp. YIM 98790 TaxID=2689077 RepID=UPI00140A51C7|nr:TIGR02679 family protein [Streptomyces sp. YIM 98790]
MTDRPTPLTALDRPELRKLWQTAHHRLSSGHPVTRLRPGPLDDEERNALADLLGLARLPGPRPTVPLARLDSALSEAYGLTTREVAAAVVGPLTDRAADRRRAESERTALWSWLETHPVVTAQPALLDWVGHTRSTGLAAGSTTVTRALLTDALTVLAALPAQGEPLPVFATRLLRGDPHALDDGTRLSTLVLRALAALHATDPPTDAAARRHLWNLAGVTDDGLSSTVLAAGLRPAGDGLLASLARTCAGAGQAVSLTLTQLRSPGAFTPPPVPVHITENPSVLAAALHRFGPGCPPLVCTSGWPGGAVMLLLRLLAEAGSPLRYHGDFDGEGLRIAAHIFARTPARPWRMTTADYLDALRTTPAGPSPGRITDAPWDPALAPALRHHATAIPEEAVLPRLLEDLTDSRDGPARPPGSAPPPPARP